MEISTLAEWIKNGKYRHRVEAVRGLADPYAVGAIENGLLPEEELPLVRPARGENGRYTGMVLLTFRQNEGVETLERLRRFVNQWEHTLLSFVGADGMTLELVVAYELQGGGLPEEPSQVALFQQYAYKRAAMTAFAATGFLPEEVEHDGSEGFRLSYDTAVFFQPTAHAIRMAQPTEPLTEVSARPLGRRKEVALDMEVLPGFTRREMDATKYNFICREMAFDKEQEKEVWLATLATACVHAGIDKELAIQLTIARRLFHGKDVLVRSAFNTAYEKHPLGRANPVEKSLKHQLLMEEFLRRRYMFRRNRVTGDLEYQEKHRYMLEWRPLTQEAQNDINNAAIHEGIKVWPKDLERILLSERTESYDPVREWLDTLPRWDGRDRLGEMADRVTTTTADWRDNFKIWMRSMVSQWRAGANALYGAQMVLMMIGSQGTRKSTFMRMILPKELMPFYIDRIDFTNKKEALRALSRFLLINIDEYDQISKTQTAYLKHLIQRTDVKERKLYSTTYEQSQRYAAFCATTNSLMPLKDESGSRRYMVVEVNEAIDTDTQGDKRIDYPQLYAQIVYEIEHGEPYAFTGEREQQIIARNADYYEVPNVIGIFEDHFRKPRTDETALMMSPTELLTELKMDPKNRSNATQLGSYLHRKGYKKGEKEDRRRYQVVRSKER